MASAVITVARIATPERQPSLRFSIGPPNQFTLLFYLHPDQKIQQTLSPTRVIPIGGRMALSTIRTVLSVVLILMTGNTLSLGALINTVAMTFLAFQFLVFPYQWESSLAVIERRVAPTGRAMT